MFGISSLSTGQSFYTAPLPRTQGRQTVFECDFLEGQPPYRRTSLVKVPATYSVIGDEEFVKERVPCEALASSLRHQRDLLANLRDGWDGYGAPALDGDMLDLMVGEIELASCGRRIAGPDLIPGGDGSIQAEWHLSSIEMIYRREADGARYTWVHERAKKLEHEFYGAHALAGLIRWSAALT